MSSRAALTLFQQEHESSVLTVFRRAYRLLARVQAFPTVLRARIYVALPSFLFARGRVAFPLRRSHPLVLPPLASPIDDTSVKGIDDRRFPYPIVHAYPECAYLPRRTTRPPASACSIARSDSTLILTSTSPANSGFSALPPSVGARCMHAASLASASASASAFRTPLPLRIFAGSTHVSLYAVASSGRSRMQRHMETVRST